MPHQKKQLKFNEETELKLPPNHHPHQQSSFVVKRKSKKILGTILIITTLIIIFGIYYWLAKITTLRHNFAASNTNTNNIAAVSSDEDYTDIETKADLDNYQAMSPSDEISAIISDLESTTNLNDLEKDLTAIDTIIDETNE